MFNVVLLGGDHHKRPKHQDEVVAIQPFVSFIKYFRRLESGVSRTLSRDTRRNRRGTSCQPTVGQQFQETKAHPIANSRLWEKHLWILGEVGLCDTLIRILSKKADCQLLTS